MYVQRSPTSTNVLSPITSRRECRVLSAFQEAAMTDSDYNWPPWVEWVLAVVIFGSVFGAIAWGG